MSTRTFQDYLENCFPEYTVSSTPPENRQDYSDSNFYINRKQTASSSRVLRENTDEVSSESVHFIQRSPDITLTETTSTAKGIQTLPNSEKKIREAVPKIIQNLKNNYEIYEQRSKDSVPTELVLGYIKGNFGLLYTLYRNSKTISDQFGREIGQLIHNGTYNIFISIYGTSNI